MKSDNNYVLFSFINLFIRFVNKYIVKDLYEIKEYIEKAHLS